MTVRSATHASFTLERVYDAEPQRVFKAWSDIDAKRQWMGCDPTWVQGKHELDFRIGGREMNRVGPKGGPIHAFDAVYHDIVPNERIIFSYDLRFDDRLISVSLATIELKREGKRTRLILTEHGAFLDGYDGAAEREEGTAEGLDRLAGLLPSMPI